jgi:hypothetical protein
MHRRMLPLCTHLRIAFTHDVEEKGVDIVVEVLVVQKHLGQVAQVLSQPAQQIQFASLHITGTLSSTHCQCRTAEGDRQDARRPSAEGQRGAGRCAPPKHTKTYTTDNQRPTLPGTTPLPFRHLPQIQTSFRCDRSRRRAGDAPACRHVKQPIVTPDTRNAAMHPAHQHHAQTKERARTRTELCVRS